MTREFVVVHGMSHGAWSWEPLARRLEKNGHRVVAMDLPGHGRRAAERARASVDAYARAVADAMIQAGVVRGVVVGHSMGGMVIPKVAELVPARVAHLVFLAAVVLRDGESLLGTQIPHPNRPMMEGLAPAAGAVDGTRAHARVLRDGRAVHVRALPARRGGDAGARGGLRDAPGCHADRPRLRPLAG